MSHGLLLSRRLRPALSAFAALTMAVASPTTGAHAAPRPLDPPPALSADSTAALRNALIPAAAMQSDLTQLDAAFRRLHPALFRYHTEKSWQRAVDSVKQWASVPRSRGDAFVAFSRLVASLRCGHTYLSFWNQPRAVHTWLTDGADKLPFEYDLVAGDRWVVNRSATFLAGDSTAVLPGDTIIAVNSVPVPSLVRELLPLIRADGDSDGKRRALLDFRHRKEFEAIDVFLPLLHAPIDGRYAITRRRGNETRVVWVNAMPSAVRRTKAVPVIAPKPMHEFTRLDANTAMLRVDAFDYGRDADKWEPFVRETFQVLNRDRVATLIVDLRENEGGSDEGAEFLLRHLIRSPLTLPPLSLMVAYDTVPATLRPILSTWDKAFYDRRGHVTPTGTRLLKLDDSGSWPAIIPVAPDAFTGRVIVLTSYVNSSASHILLRLLARQPGVTLIGDPSGGSLRAHTGGNLFFTTFPGTGFEVDLPLIAYEWDKRNPAGGVQPDIAVPAREALSRALQEAGVTTGAASAAPSAAQPVARATADSSAFLGRWEIEWEIGRSIAGGGSSALFARGTMAIATSGDSLVATVTTRERDVGTPGKPFTIGGRLRGDTLVMMQRSKSSISINGAGGDETEVISRWMLTVQDDVLRGTIAREGVAMVQGTMLSTVSGKRAGR